MLGQVDMGWLIRAGVILNGQLVFVVKRVQDFDFEIAWVALLAIGRKVV